MATKYTAFVWPPLIFPLPTFTGKGGLLAARPNWPPMIFPLPTFRGKGGNTFAIGPRPPMVFPLALASRTSKVATPAAPTMPSMVAPTPASSGKVTFTNAPAVVSPVGQAKIVNPYTTQDQINTLFRIVSPRPGSGT